jgi:parallel beta-helix repeat protein
MRHPSAKTKKILIALAFLVLIMTATNSLGIAQAATDRQSYSTATSAPTIFERSIQPNTLPTEGNPAAAVSSLRTPQIRPSPATPVENYVFQPQPNGAITAFKNSTGKITYTSTDLSILLNLIPSNASVTLKSGTYTMRTPYNPKDGQHIIGESRSEVKLFGYKTKTDYALIDGSASNLELANFTFNVNNPNPTAKQTPNCALGILLLGSSNYLHDITLYNAYLQGIVMGLYGQNPHSNRNLVENCEVYNCGNDGIVLDYSINSQVKNCYIHDSYGPVAGGVNVAYGSRGCTVRDCTANNTAYGFATDNSMGPPEDSITFLNNSANAPYINGFMVDGGQNIAFEGNTASNYAQYGFVSSGNPVNGMCPAYVSFNGNVATDAKSFNGVGFYISQGSDFTFTGNHASGNLVGFELQIMTGKTQIESGTFSGNTAHDVMVVNNPVYTSITDCRMSSSAPIWVDAASGPYTTITNCW